MLSLQKFDNYKNDNTVLFLPSGELINISNKDMDKLEDYVILDYNNKYESYIIGDDLRDVIKMVIKK